MNKILILFFFNLMMQSSLAIAASTGSGQTLSQGQFELGVEYNQIFEIDLEPKYKDLYLTNEIANSSQVYGTATYGLFDNGLISSDIKGKLGAADLKLRAIDFSFSVEEQMYSMGLFWGLGGKVSYRLEKDVMVSFHSQYNEWEPKIESLVYDGAAGQIAGGSKKIKVSEFQAAVLLSYKGKNERSGLTFIPYGGPYINLTNNRTKRSTEDPNFTDTADLDSNQGDDPYGLILGMEIYGFDENFKLSIEGRFLYEQALTLSFHYNF